MAFRKIKVTPDQLKVLETVLYKGNAVVIASHAVGKSYLAAILACYFAETRPQGAGIISAPVYEQIQTVIFKEMRKILPDSPFFAPKAPTWQRTTSNFIIGKASSNPDAFQGMHNPQGSLIILDEASGVDIDIWSRIAGMIEKGVRYKNESRDCFLAIGNPYSLSSPLKLAEDSNEYNVMYMNALTHPNIVNKNSSLFPGAISYENFLERLGKECHELRGEDEKHKAFEYEGKLYVPDEPLFSIGILGRFPDQSDFAVFNQTDLQNLQGMVEDVSDADIVMGVDPAAFGMCASAFAIRRGPNLIYTEEIRGFSLMQTAEHIKKLCRQFATNGQDPRKVKVYIDAIGLGEGLVEMCGVGQGKYNFLAIKGSQAATSETAEERYVNKRTQLYINLRNLARNKKISISMLPKKDQQQIIKQLRIPEFTLDNKGRTVLEKKEKIIERLGESCDLADAIGFCFYMGQNTFSSF